MRSSGAILLLLLALLIPACSGGPSTGGATSGAPTDPDEGVVHRLHDLGWAVADLDLGGLVLRARQVAETLAGPRGGQVSISGDLQVDPAAPGTPSVLQVEFQGYTFQDGLALSGGSGTLTTRLWGTSEATANGTQVLKGTGVTFARGSTSEVHDFEVAMQLVNGRIVDSRVSLDSGTPVTLGFTLHVANMSQNPDDQVFLTVVGKDQAQTAWYYLASPTDLQMTEFEDEPGEFLSRDANGAYLGADKYSLRLSELTPVDEHTRRLLIPRENLVSGRIFLSFGRKLQGLAIQAPFYSPSGQPITQAATATAQSSSGAQVTLSGLDANKTLYVGEPVSFPGGSSTVTRIVSATVVELASTAGLAPPATLTFQPDQSQFAAAKLNLTTPSPTGMPDYLTTWEFMELSATTDPTVADPFYTLFANTSAIDFFSVGLGMAVDYAGVPGGQGPTQKVVGFGASAADIMAGKSVRDAVFARFNNTGSPSPATPSEFQAFVTAKPAPGGTGDPHMTFGKAVDPALDLLRVLGPPQVIATEPDHPQGKLATYLNAAIAQDWDTFLAGVAAKGLTLQFPDATNPSFTFRAEPVPAGSPVPTTFQVECTQAAGTNTGLHEKYDLPAPTGYIVFQCDDTLNPGPSPNNYQNGGTDAHKRLVSLICAAFTRGVFAGDWSKGADFYKRADLKYNFFSKVMHDFALDQIIYGFAYDDVYGHDSTLAGPIGLTRKGVLPSGDLGDISEVTITIPDFLAPTPPTPTPSPSPSPASAALTVQAVVPDGADCQDPGNTSTQGFVVHFTPEDGSGDLVGTLDASGQATVSGLKASVPYHVWIAPANGTFYVSYSAYGMYDGTTSGNWSSSSGASTAGVIRLQIGQLEAGVGPCLVPNPQAPGPGGYPPPTAGSGQANWGNLTPP